MEKYQKPTAEIIRFRQVDVISASGTCDAECIGYSACREPNCDTQGTWVCGID
jgi:hypothetical protein